MTRTSRSARRHRSPRPSSRSPPEQFGRYRNLKHSSSAAQVESREFVSARLGWVSPQKRVRQTGLCGSVREAVRLHCSTLPPRTPELRGPASSPETTPTCVTKHPHPPTPNPPLCQQKPSPAHQSTTRTAPVPRPL